MTDFNHLVRARGKEAMRRALTPALGRKGRQNREDSRGGDGNVTGGRDYIPGQAPHDAARAERNARTKAELVEMAAPDDACRAHQAEKVLRKGRTG